MLPHLGIEGVKSISVAARVGVASAGLVATSGKEVSVAC